MHVAIRAYHHGDLRAALIAAGLRLSRSGGIDAIGLREVTREAGVSPSAAYRHFADHRALVVAVALAAQEHLAGAIEQRMASLSEHLSGADAAVARLRGVGLGYIDFALAEPGWYELALLTFDPEQQQTPTVSVDNGIPRPFQLLLEALDGCVDAGALLPAQRENAEWPCWAAVHGFADIATRGALKVQPPEVLAALGARVVDSIVVGIMGSAPDPTTAR